MNEIKNKIKKILEDLWKEHPYKVPGNPDTYSTYNEGWTDCLTRLDALFTDEFFQCGEEETKRNKDIANSQVLGQDDLPITKLEALRMCKCRHCTCLDRESGDCMAGEWDSEFCPIDKKRKAMNWIIKRFNRYDCYRCDEYKMLCKGERIDNKQWIEGRMYRTSEDLNPFIMLLNRHGVSHEINPNTLCRYTSLKDHHKNRIWENDIVRRYGGDNLFIVKWNFAAGRWDIVSLSPSHIESMPLTCSYVFEVIGNIFTMPELITYKKSWKGKARPIATLILTA